MLDEMREIFGKKGLLIVLFGAGVLLLLVMLTDKGESTELVAPSGYASYPDAVTNANVIIDSVNEYTEFSKNEVLDAIGSTNGFIESGLANLESNMKAEMDQIDASFDTITGTLDGINTSIKDIKDNTTTLVNRPSTITSNSYYTYTPHDDSHLQKDKDKLPGGNAQYIDPDPEPVTNLGHANGSIVVVNGKPVTATATLKKAGNS